MIGVGAWSSAKYGTSKKVFGAVADAGRKNNK